MTRRQDADHPQARTVPLAEDDDAFRATLVLWLEDAGKWTVREATNGREALDLVDSTVDVLVLDRLMPELTGPDVVEKPVESVPFLAMLEQTLR